MKRYGWLYEKAFTKDNIKLAIIRASKGKKKRKIVRKVLSDIDYYTDEIYHIAWTYSYKPSPYLKFTLKDPSSGKMREICKPRFYPDHCIHWCIYLVLYPILSKRLISKTYSSLKGRGQIYGQKKIKKQLKNRTKTKYYLKVDIRKFYPSIDTHKLEIMLEHKIKDPKLLKLIHDILKQEKGLPIGMILSQLFANYYITDIDYIFNSKFYNRYADDVVIFGSNKRKLLKQRVCLQECLDKKSLTLKSNYQVYKTDKEMLDYMGFRFNHDKVIMRRKIMIKANRDILKWKRNKTYKIACSIISHMGYVKHSNSYMFYSNRIRPYVNFNELKQIIRSNTNENLQIAIEY